MQLLKSRLGVARSIVALVREGLNINCAVFFKSGAPLYSVFISTAARHYQPGAGGGGFQQ